MKQQIVKGIKEKLSALGLPVFDGTDTDVAVSTEFVNTKWPTGSKKICYEAAILADEHDQTVYMFEKTTESGGGFSFGMSGESSLQSGSTSYRHMRGVHYGLDGKAFDYELDLGAVPKAVRETALQRGWKFKTVINRKKASYARKD